MKKKVRYFSVFISLILVVVFNCAQAQSNDSHAQALEMIKGFYTSYITDMDKGDISKLDGLQKKSCTTNLLHKIQKLSEQSGADPFLKAQDSNIKFLSSLTVEKDLKREGHYMVSYGTKEKVVINLTVVKVNGSYKIDAAW
jgi:hypothetical protein